MTHLRPAAFLAALLVFVHLSAFAQDAAVRKARALELPLSPGTVALFAEHAMDPAIQTRLAEALRHQDAAIRTLAARLAFVSASKTQVPQLVRALSVETDDRAIAEQVRALLGLQGASADDLVLNEVVRLGGVGAHAMVDQLARTRPAALAERLPALADLLPRERLGAFVGVAAAQYPDTANSLAQALLNMGDPFVWYAFVGNLRENGVVAPEPALLRALSSREGRLRELTLWALAYAAADGDPVAPAVREAARTPQDAGEPTWEQFGGELLSRVLGATPTPRDWVGLMRRDYTKNGISVALFPWLTKPEIEIIAGARGDKDAAERLQRSMRDGRDGLLQKESRLNRLRTLESMAPGFIADLIAVTGCKPMGRGFFAAAELAYTPDGRPRAASVLDQNLSPACQAAIRSGIALTIPGEGRAISAAARDVVVLLFEPQLLSCAALPAGPRPPAAAPGAKRTFAPAKSTWEEPYDYPAAMRKSAISGTVLVDLAISHTGCVTSAQTRRSLGPAIDLSVVQAASRWRFTPASIDATPVAGGYTIVYNVQPPDSLRVR